jgi:hypothetical protein
MVKKKVKKKVTKKKVATATATRSGSFGRPKGAKSYRPTGLEVRRADPLGRKGSPNKQKGYRRVILETKDETFAENLERLVILIRKKDKGLLSMLTPKGRKVTKKKAKAKASA